MTDDPILAGELALERAMFTNDVAALDRLIDDALIFTSLSGDIVGKADDLEAHRMRRLRLTTIEAVDRQMVRAGGCVVVNALMALAGTFDGSPFDARFRYTRVWSEQPDGWKIIAGHMSAVP